MARVSFPARCAVAVICGEHLVSQVYPGSVPVEVFIDDVVELLNDDLKRRGVPGLNPESAYELQRINGTRLDVTKTLDELGVEDGATLVLAPATDGDVFEPQYEALSTGLARAGRKLFEPVTPRTAAATAMAILAMVSVAVAALAAYSRANGQTWLPALVAGGVGLAIAAGAFWVWRWWPDRRGLLAALCWQAVPPLTVGVAAAAPGSPGAAHLFIAALATGVLGAATFSLTQRHVAFAAAAVTLAAITGAVAGVRMFAQTPAQHLGMMVLVGLLVLLTMAPTIALWSARIRPPHFGSITGRDLFRRGDGMPVDAVAPVDDDADDEPHPDTTPAGQVVAAAARRANGVLSGICLAAGATLPVAVWATVLPGQPRAGAAVALAALFVVIFISRARAFSDWRQGVALVCGAAAAVCSAVVRYVGADHGTSSAALVAGSLVLVAFAAAGLAAALLVPVTKFTPLVRMAAEWVELAAIVAALPLAAWIGGLFTWVRMR